MTTLAIDIETYSSVDLKKSGVYPYTESPDFEILLFAYAFNGDPVEVIDLANFEFLPDRVVHALQDSSIIKTAFNASFERTCIAKHFKMQMPPEQWRCTAVHALTLGLPGTLDGVAKALKLEQQKDSAGKALIRYFSIPCKPTKTNGQRTRNMPEHEPEKWEQYKDYCVQDVVVEQDIRKMLLQYEIPETEQKLWELDQRINDRGIRVNPQLVQNAIACDLANQERQVEEAVALTGLENPNSVSQLKKWLSDAAGLEVESLNKAVVPELLEQTDDETVKRMLELRQEMAKTSVKKYQAMQRGLCLDDRVRGLLQFYGAGRTGRWAGRLVQVQNLPRNKLRDLDVARNLVLSGDYDLLELLFGNVPDVLSQLIRTAFIPSDGCRFIVSDFSAIEARVIAWLAGEQWRLDVFNTHGKIYEASAAQMFKVPIESVGKGSDLRQRGKVAELACIAEGQLVLTDKGLVPIEDVKRDHRVWDGYQWVKHEGVVYRGIKEVIEYDGLTATADHLVWIEGQSEPVRFDYAATSGARLIQSEYGRDPIWMGHDYQSRETLQSELEGSESTYPMQRMWERTVDPIQQPYTWAIERVPSVLSAATNPKMVGSKADCCQAEMYKSERCELHQLWGSRDSVQIPISIGCRSLDYRQSRAPGSKLGVGSDRHKWSLRTWEPAFCSARSQSREPEAYTASRLESGSMALCSLSGDAEACSGYESRRDSGRSPASRFGQTEELATNCRKARVYDILNAGPRHRFTVSNRLVHNCGYQGGPNALIAMGALEMGLKEEELQGIIDAWRAANPAIKKFWFDVGNAAIKAVDEKRTVKLQFGLAISSEPGYMFIHLPSGRRLAYVNPRLEQDKRFNRLSLTYEGVEKGQWRRLHTYGGKLVENIVQAVARDCLAVAMLRLDDSGFNMTMHVHDEVVIDEKCDFDTMAEVESIMGQPIEWAPGLPLRADAFEADYYMKD
ncbi:hypothetical protein EEL32_25465 [Brevibacillus laterosporus]|nr:hypothetical protein EEL32_25465 [Brevibacillus laterosporus]